MLDLKLVEMEFMVQVWLHAKFDENTEEKKPTVQVGDPFTEKLLTRSLLRT